MNLETRKIASAPTIRADAGDPANAPHLVGYALKFGVESCALCDPKVNGGRPFVEVLAAGCCTRTLVEMPDVRALYNHDTGDLLGRTTSKTLALAEDEIGLSFDVALPDTQAGRDVRTLVARGDITGCSFGFCVVEDSVEERPGLPSLRTILDLDLYEISPAVAFPAYEDTEVKLRAARRLLLSREHSLGRLNHALRQLLLDVD